MSKKKYVLMDHGQDIKSITVHFEGDDTIGQISDVEGIDGLYQGDHVNKMMNHIGKRFTYSPMMNHCMNGIESILIISRIIDVEE